MLLAKGSVHPADTRGLTTIVDERVNYNTLAVIWQTVEERKQL